MNDDIFTLVPEWREPRAVLPGRRLKATPNVEPKTREPKGPRQPRLTSAESDRAATIAKAYCALQPLSTFMPVRAIVGKAIAAKRWSDGEILNALVQLAKDDRRVTTETLRIELTYHLGERRRQRERGELDETSVVYLIGANESRLVKIGTSTDRMSRLHSIQLMCPVELRILYHLPGGFELENALHTAFKAYRRHGEWFDFGKLDPVKTVVARLPSVLRKLGVDPAVMFLTAREARDGGEACMFVKASEGRNDG